MMRVGWLLLILLVIGAGSWVMRGPAIDNDSGADDGAAAQDPGYVSIDANLIETGDDGKPLYRLQAARIEQQPPSPDIQLVGPQLQYEPAQQPAWALNAERGQLAAAQQRVELTGNVEARSISIGDSPLTVRSARLSVDMLQQTVRSDVPVSIDWGRLRLTAQRMFINVKDGTLRLESSGHGELAPQ
jgi:LPS export ABC transporter protein LptC